MKLTFDDAIMKLEDFCKTYNALSMEDKLLFAVLGPNGSDVAATVANEINEPKDPHGGLTDEEFDKYSHFDARSIYPNGSTGKPRGTFTDDNGVRWYGGLIYDDPSSVPGRFQITAHFFNDTECLKFRDFSRQHIVANPSFVIPWLDEEGVLCLQLTSLRDSDLAKVFDATEDFAFAELELWEYGEAIKNWVKVGDFYPNEV